MHIATIVKDKKSGQLHVRFGRQAQDGGDVTIVDVLNGTDLKELKDRVERFVKDIEKGP